MIVAVLSDIHDNIWNLERVLPAVTREGAQRMCFLGDFCAPFTLKQIGEGFSGPVDVVFGNNDGDIHLLHVVAESFPHVTLHGDLAEIALDGTRVALNHYPEIARRLAESGAYDIVLSGHDHQKYVHTIGTTLWANPGEIMGRFGSPSWGLLDTTARTFRHIDVDHT